MTLRLGINGFGRIGRLVFRALHDRGLAGKSFEVVAINDLVPADNLAYLFKYDTMQGSFPGEVFAQGESMRVGDKSITVSAHKDPAQAPWKAHGVDLVLECSGIFRSPELAGKHIEAGAKRVLLSAPGKGDVKTVVMGVNHESYDPAKDTVVSNASCTTNCLAPVAKVLLDSGIGIAEGLMTTVHAYTASQRTVDGPNKKNWRLGRGAASNIIPSTTGAAKAVSLVLPELKGKLSGMALRVPTATVSVVDLTFRSETSTGLAKIHEVMRAASEGALKGILGYTEDKLVSTDFVHDPRSCIYDADASIELNPNFFKLVIWYDNEWGYAQRLVDLMQYMVQRGF